MTLSVDLAATFAAAGTAPFGIDASIEVDTGETLVVLGPSGSGKTLLLETVAGFHDHEGTVALDSEAIDDRPPEARGFGFVFQDYALFPHMTVRENVAFGTRYRSAARSPEAVLADLGVGELADRYPPTLSGGEAQRVALARSLAVDPSVLLLDEPLSALDVPTRQDLREDLRSVLDARTAVYVTHNRTTARALAGRIAVMADGRIVQVGSPAAVFDRPASPLVARFTGSNCLPLSAVPALADRVDPDAGTHLAIRPEAIELDGPDPVVRGTVEEVTREDAAYRVRVSIQGEGEAAGATVDVFATDPPEQGATVGLTVREAAVSVC